MRLQRSLKALFQCISTCWLLFATPAFSGQETRNGDGIAEQSFTFAYLNLERIYSICELSSFCLRSPEEKKLLSAIRQALPREYRSSRQLRFESGKANPSRFLIDGQIRVAVTGNAVGDPIYINTDLLYSRSNNQEPQYLDFHSAVGILTHELGHHHGIKDETFLDLLGAQLKAFTLQKMERIQVDTYVDDSTDNGSGIRLTMMALHSDVPYAQCCTSGPDSWLLLTDEHQIYSLDQVLSSKLKCPISVHNPTGREARLRGFRLFNLRWLPWRWERPGSTERVFPFHASILLECQNPSFDNEFGGIYHETDWDLVLNAHLDWESPANDPQGRYFWLYQEKKTELQLIPRK